MVKGVSRQVIVVKSPEPNMFEQAIFILRDDVPREGITDEMLLREAQAVAKASHKHKWFPSGPVWACVGAASTALVWLLSVLL
ncbi:MAG: translation initiation factor 2 [Oscillospiraceae bacterium]|nr:translation initiation factor 2 [Oscillospiraceae bacterium]